VPAQGGYFKQDPDACMCTCRYLGSNQLTTLTEGVFPPKLWMMWVMACWPGYVRAEVCAVLCVLVNAQHPQLLSCTFDIIHAYICTWHWWINTNMNAVMIGTNIHLYAYVNSLCIVVIHFQSHKHIHTGTHAYIHVQASVGGHL
jgi:hypothetical protein